MRYAHVLGKFIQRHAARRHRFTQRQPDLTHDAPLDKPIGIMSKPQAILANHKPSQWQTLNRSKGNALVTQDEDDGTEKDNVTFSLTASQAWRLCSPPWLSCAILKTRTTSYVPVVSSVVLGIFLDECV